MTNCKRCSELEISVKMKERKCKLFAERQDHAESLLSKVAKLFGLKESDYIYGTNLLSNENVILTAIDETLSKAGDKAKLKKRIAELETENSVLRSLVGMGDK